MKTKISYLLIILLIIPFCLESKSLKKWKEVYPVKDKVPVKFLIKGEERTYYSFSKDVPVSVEVAGPAKLKVYARLGLPGNFEGLRDFKINVRMDKKDAGTYSYTAEKASGVKFKDKNDVIPGKKKVLYLKIPEGIHTFTFLLSEPAGSNSYARFYVKTKSKKIVMTSMTPQSYSQVTTEILGDQEIIYYVATYTQPIRMRIFGPTKVQVINRLDYDITMKGKQNYSITVLENGKQVSIEKFSTSKSSLGYYRDRTQIVPGDDKKFFLSVPEGEHIYDFQLSGTSAKSAALRFMIPEDDLDIGEE